jgi:hypothetical protein
MPSTNISKRVESTSEDGGGGITSKKDFTAYRGRHVDYVGKCLATDTVVELDSFEDEAEMDVG